MLINLFGFVPSFAHEVYVLTPHEIKTDYNTQASNPLQALASSHNKLLFALFFLLIGGIIGISIFLKSKNFFKRVGGYLDKTTIIAPDLIRIAFGVSLILSASHKAVFGPELPIDSFPFSSLLNGVLILLGVVFIFGIFSRMFASLAILVWLFFFANTGWYALNYINYLGEAIAIFLLPKQTLTIDNVFSSRFGKVSRFTRWEQYSMPATRILFGFSLFYTAISIKFLSPALPLDVVGRYHLTNYFAFDPLFVVLGAGLIEMLIATLYMLGLLQRLNTVFFLIFITLSLLFFKESVWPHYLLIALGIGIFLHRPDKMAADKYLFPR